MVKKLRYYARFIVVSLLLNKVDLVKELIQVIISLYLNFTTSCASYATIFFIKKRRNLAVGHRLLVTNYRRRFCQGPPIQYFEIQGADV